MWTALVFYPDLNSERLNWVREKFGPNYPAYKEHMPRLYALPDTVSSDRLDKHLRRVLEHWRPFEIHIQGLFKSRENWLLLGVKEGNNKVTGLHQEIYSGILKPYQRKDLPFEPHIGLGLFTVENYDPFFPTQVRLKEEEYRTALHEAKSRNFDFGCKVSVLDLIQGQNDLHTKPVTIRNYSLV